jgi:hypothetical protein
LCSFIFVLLIVTMRSVPSGRVTAAPEPTSTDRPKPSEGTVIATYILPAIPLGPFQNAVLPNSVANDRKLQVGSIGSDMWHGPNDPPNEFWLVSDRGPNGQGTVGGQRRRTFLMPEFSPVILRVQTQGDSINVLQSIPILTQSGKPVTGLPNTDGRDEVPYDASAQTRLHYNPNGLDIEGLVRTSAGDFWLCEEYSPSIGHVDQTGKVLKRYIPEGLILDGMDYPISPVLPAIYATRKSNRGFEGMTISPDEKTLYLVLQSPLYNPDKKTGDTSRHTRVLVFDIASEKPVAEYVYRSGVPDKVEGLVVLDQTVLAIVSDNDFDIGKFDENGNNVGEGVKTKIVVIGLPKPLP